jgi:hypothetical protein
MAHGDAREGKWRGTWRMEWVVSTLHTTSEHGVSSITNADVHTSAASIRLNWRSRRFKWTRQFRRKTKTGFCACAITFQTQSTTDSVLTTRCSCHNDNNSRHRVVKHVNNNRWTSLEPLLLYLQRRVLETDVAWCVKSEEVKYAVTPALWYYVK